MVIGKFLRIDDLRCIHRCRYIRLNLKALLDHRNKFRHQRCHIIRQIPAVGTGICDELTLIKRLRIVKRLLRCIPVSLVCFSLKCGQIIELRSFFGLYFTLYRADRDRFAITGRYKRISVSFIINSCRRMKSPQLRSAVKYFCLTKCSTSWSR